MRKLDKIVTEFHKRKDYYRKYCVGKQQGFLIPPPNLRAMLEGLEGDEEVTVAEEALQELNKLISLHDKAYEDFQAEPADTRSFAERAREAGGSLMDAAGFGNSDPKLYNSNYDSRIDYDRQAGPQIASIRVFESK